jgi:hypothetical protein
LEGIAPNELLEEKQGLFIEIVAFFDPKVLRELSTLTSETTTYETVRRASEMPVE